MPEISVKWTSISPPFCNFCFTQWCCTRCEHRLFTGSFPLRACKALSMALPTTESSQKSADSQLTLADPDPGHIWAGCAPEFFCFLIGHRLWGPIWKIVGDAESRERERGGEFPSHLPSVPLFRSLTAPAHLSSPLSERTQIPHPLITDVPLTVSGTDPSHPSTPALSLFLFFFFFFCFFACGGKAVFIDHFRGHYVLNWLFLRLWPSLNVL